MSVDCYTTSATRFGTSKSVLHLAEAMLWRSIHCCLLTMNVSMWISCPLGAIGGNGGDSGKPGTAQGGDATGGSGAGCTGSCVKGTGEHWRTKKVASHVQYHPRLCLLSGVEKAEVKQMSSVEYQQCAAPRTYACVGPLCGGCLAVVTKRCR